jgi:succinate dehydrogenase/fumarate reductase flavoprotein subunit
MNATTPKLDPFADKEPRQGSPIGLIILAAILGIATAAGVAIWRSPKQVEQLVQPDKGKAEGFFSTDSTNWDLYTADLDSLIKELRAEIQGYQNRERDFQAMELRIEAEKRELERLRKEIEQMRDSLTTKTTELQSSEKTNLRSLARTYSSMKPAQAVAIFAEMDDKNAVKILALMKPDVVAKILGEMSRTPDPNAADGAKTATLAAKAAELSNQLRLLQQQQQTAQ